MLGEAGACKIANLIQRFGLVPAGSPPLKQKPWILFMRSPSRQEAQIGETNSRRIVVRRMSAIRVIVIPCVACFFTTATLAADRISEDKAIAIASGYLRSPKVDIASFAISVERRTTPPHDAVIPVERFGGRLFWLISFTPRKRQFGGAYAVYVAADTGEILGSRGYK
jgi:hypothetical protein